MVKCEFALFQFREKNGTLTAFKLYQPLERREIDAGFDISMCKASALYLEYLEPLVAFDDLPPFSLLKFFGFENTFYVQFLPLAFPSPTSFQTGRFYNQIFDRLFYFPVNNYNLVLGNAIHRAVESGILGLDPAEAFNEEYYGSDFFRENRAADEMTAGLHSEYILKCNDCVSSLSSYSGEITNELHVFSENLSLEGKIDVYIRSESAEAVVELKTKSLAYSKEAYNAQLALYIYEILRIPSEEFYCEVIGVIEHSENVFFRDERKSSEQTSFLDDTQRNCQILLELLSVLVEKRNIYILSHYLLLKYFLQKENRELIKRLLCDFCRHESTENTFDNLFEYISAMLSGNELEIRESVEIIGQLETILEVQLHESVVSTYSSLNSCEIQEKLAKSSMKEFSVGQECCDISVGMRSYSYQIFGESAAELNGCYRLTETNNDIIERNAIFCRIQDNKLSSSSQLFDYFEYLAHPVANRVLRGISAFGKHERSVRRGSFEQESKKKACLLVSDVTMQSKEILSEFKATGDFAADQRAYYARTPLGVVISFEEFFEKGETMQWRELFVDANLRTDELVYCVLSRDTSMIEACTEGVYEDALERLERLGVSISTQVLPIIIDLD